MKLVIIYIIQLLMFITTLISYLPQIIKSIKTKCTKDISVSSWILFSATSILYLIMLILEDVGWKLISLQVVEASLINATLILAIIFQKRDKNG